jgi:deoxycytidine triphosphate deaminase
MAKVICGKKLIKLIEEGKVIEHGSVANCDAIKYDFTLDSKFLKAQYGAPVDYNSLRPVEQKEAIIASGEVVFVLTKENINLPDNMFLQLSPKRGMTEFGVLTLGGFAVDPGYSGKLMFGLYNFSSRPFRLLPGRKLAGAVFYELDEKELVDIDEVEPPKSIDDFPPRLVDMIRECAPIGLSSLEDAVSVIRKQVEAIEKAVISNKDSIDDINKIIRKTRDDIDENNKQIERIANRIDDLVTGLNQEVNLRKESEARLDKKIDNATKEVDGKIKFLKGALWLATAFGGILITLLITWLCGWLKFN